MITRRSYPRLRAWPVRACVVTLLGGLATSVRAGSIFDDDWLPSKPSTPVALPSPVTRPVVPQPVVPPPATRPAAPPPTQPAAEPAPASPGEVAVAPAAPTRRPVPPAADRARSRKLLKDVFARELADRTPAARRALAAQLLKEAGNDSDTPSDQFVLFVGSAEAARDGQDLGACTKAADALSAAYDVDGVQFKADFALKMLLRADTPEATTRNCREGLRIVEQLIEADDYATAGRLLVPLRPVAEDPALSRQLQNLVKEVSLLRTAEPRFAPSFEKLRTAPLDPAANLAAGQFYCYFKGDWARGLPRLALGADPALQSLAKQDLAAPTRPEAQVAIADAWWSYAVKLDEFPKSRVMAHAGALYAAADPQLSGLDKLRVDKRLKELTPTASAPPAQPQVIDLLKTATQTGRFRLDSGVLVLAPGASIATAKSFRPPVAFQIEVMTDERDFRIGYAANQMIFNWEGNRDQLRVDGGPAAGKHKQGAGRLPAGRWTTIELVVNTDEMIMSVDGTERYRVKGDFSKVDQPFTARAHNGETAIKSLVTPAQ